MSYEHRTAREKKSSLFAAKTMYLENLKDWKLLILMRWLIRWYVGTGLHGSHVSACISVQSEALTIFVQDYLLKDVHIANSLGRQRWYLSLGQRAGLLTIE